MDHFARRGIPDPYRPVRTAGGKKRSIRAIGKASDVLRVTSENAKRIGAGSFDRRCIPNPDRVVQVTIGAGSQTAAIRAENQAVDAPLVVAKYHDFPAGC